MIKYEEYRHNIKIHFSKFAASALLEVRANPSLANLYSNKIIQFLKDTMSEQDGNEYFAQASIAGHLCLIVIDARGDATFIDLNNEHNSMIKALYEACIWMQDYNGITDTEYNDYKNQKKKLYNVIINEVK